MSLTFNHLSADSFESHLKAGRKRPRVREPVSCWQCRTRKIRCNREAPCKPCQDRGVSSECAYTTSKDKDGQSQPVSRAHSVSRPKARATPSQSQTQTRTQTQTQTPSPSPSSRELTPETPSAGERRELIPAPGRNVFQGSSVKTRMMGLSHWMAPYNEMIVVKAMLDRAPEFQASRRSFAELKVLVRACNALPPSELTGPTKGSSLRGLLPDRETCQCWTLQYCRTYGRIYCIVDPAALDLEMDQICAGSLENPVNIAVHLLVIAIAMQNVESERLNGRRLARYVEDCIHLSPRFQKPSIAVVQVLLLLTVLKSISASDTDKIYDLMAIQGLTIQIVSSMGLHRDPALFPDMSPYHAEVRKRLWACFLRCNLAYCIRSGSQFNLPLSESDCPLPTTANLRYLDPATANGAFDFDFESDDKAEGDVAFTIAATKLAKIIAPVYQVLYSTVPPELSKMQNDLRAAFRTLLSELPPSLSPKSKIEDPIRMLQQSVLMVLMDSFSSVVTMSSTMGTTVGIFERSQLLEIWDYTSSVLHKFQNLCQQEGEVGNMAVHLLWTHAGRAALSACSVVRRLRTFDLNRIMPPHPQQSVYIFQRLLVDSLIFLSQLWQSRFHLGPLTAKINLILAVCLKVTASLYSTDYDDAERIRHELLAEGVEAAEKEIADMKLKLQQRQQAVMPADMFVGQQQYSPFSSPGLSNMGSSWPTKYDMVGHSEVSSDAETPPFQNHDFFAMDFQPDAAFTSMITNFNFPTEGAALQDSAMAFVGDPAVVSLMS
ncbi:hypothetical protein B0T22DRAFT_428674 [Podospora appendiculata]|uniref:Zn(2)-C6 fungal-type domain-containing protein n=1 Tax=Podospora appendiculata TaxID=314037 RepID=A0AAE0X572_9PEZI|nr:hypothetical protein B0T22DRAFT_428674 [Podospora appendiculata]